VRTSNLDGVRSLQVIVEWIAILVAAVVVLAGVLAIAAVVAAGASDRMRDSADIAQSALWASGYSEHEQHLLATLASVARADLGAGSVEIVLTPPGWSGDGVVVTGSRLAPNRLAARIAVGSGTAGRAIASGSTELAGPRGAAPGLSNGVVEVAVPITGPYGVTGVVLAVSVGPERWFGKADVGRLQQLAARTGRSLASPVGNTA
jgi:hypothetical protein